MKLAVTALEFPHHVAQAAAAAAAAAGVRALLLLPGEHEALVLNQRRALAISSSLPCQKPAARIPNSPEKWEDQQSLS